MRHTVTILWKSGAKTRHRTSNLTVGKDSGGRVVRLNSEDFKPRVMGLDIGEVVAVFRGRV